MNKNNVGGGSAAETGRYYAALVVSCEGGGPEIENPADSEAKGRSTTPGRV